MPVNPKEFLIIPDKKFREGTEISVPATDGVRPSVAISQATNQGNLSLTIIGAPNQAGGVSLVTGGTFNIVDSGSLNSTAFIKQMSDASNFSGEPDRRYTYNHSSPIQVLQGQEAGYGATAFFVPSSGREFVFRSHPERPSFGKILYAYRDVNSSSYYGGSFDATYEDEQWTQGTIDLTVSPYYRGIDTPDSEACQIDVCTMEDGSLRMAVVYNLDIDIYTSTDGINWTLICERTLSRFADQRKNIRNMRIASSSGYLKIVFADVGGATQSFSGAKLFGICSSDGGATWKVTDQETIECSPMAGQGEDSYGFDLCGLGSKSGNFLLAIRAYIELQGITQFVGATATYISYGFEQFVEDKSKRIQWNEGEHPSAGNISSFLIRPQPRLLLCNGQDWLWLWVDYTQSNNPITSTQGNSKFISFDDTGGAVALYYIDKSKDITNAKWQSLNKVFNSYPIPASVNVLSQVGNLFPRVSGLLASNRYGYGRAKMYACYDGIAIFGALWDRESNFVKYLQTGCLYQRISGWDEQPVNQYFDAGNATRTQVPANKWQPAGRLFIAGWQTGYGAPNGLNGGTGSLWQRNRTPISTRTWNPHRLKLRQLTPQSGPPATTYSGSSDMYTYEDPLSQIGEQPEVCWGFASSSLQGTFGCMVEFVCKINTHVNSQYNDVGVKLRSFLNAPFTSDNAARFLGLFVEVRKDRARVLDLNDSNAQLVEIEFTTGGKTATELDDNYFVFRLCVRPDYDGQIHQVPRILRSTKNVDCTLEFRKYGERTWYSTAIFQPNITNTGTRKQEIIWGHHAATRNSERESCWKRVEVMSGDANQIAQAGLIATKPRNNSLRGRLISAFPVGIGDDLKAVWSGVGGMEGDSFVSTIDYDYSFRNARQFPSPRTKYRSASSVTAVTVMYDIQASSGSFSHNAVAFFNTNGKKLYVQYSDTSNFASVTAGCTIDNKIKTGKITGAQGQRISIDWDDYAPYPSEYESSDNQKYYLNIGTRVGTEFTADQVIEIDEMYGTTDVMLKDVATNFTSASVGTTIHIYTNKNYGVYPAGFVGGQYMRILQEDYGNFPEGRAEVGTVIVGTTMTFNVPLDWQYSDKTEPNVTEFKSRSGVTWGYKEGPSVRTLQGNIVGDVTEQQRRALRNRLKKETTFGEQPVVFVQDIGSYDADSILLSRYQNGVEMRNAGWHYDTVTQRWTPIGDMTITLVEVV